MKVTFEFDDEDLNDKEKRVVMERAHDLLTCITMIFEKCEKVMSCKEDLKPFQLAQEITEIIKEHSLLERV